MSGVVGVVRRDGSDADPATVGTMLDRIDHRGPDGRGAWSSGAAGLGHQLLATSPRDLSVDGPTVAAGGDFVVVADARIDNRRELVAGDGSQGIGVGPDATDAEVILAAYREWGRAAPERLVGAFAFALWDARRERLFCARDHAGIRPLYCHRSGDAFVVGSEPKAVLAHPAVDDGIDRRRLGEHLAGVFDGHRRTFYREVKRVPPAHSVTVDADEVDRERYWSLDPTRTVDLPSEEACARRFRDLFETAVECRLPTRGGDPPAAMLSGGLDSSAIACTARDSLEEALPTYTLTFESVPASDEREYAEAVVDGGGIDPTFVPGDREDPVEGLTDAVAARDGATVLPNYFLHEALYREAVGGGHRVILDGYDGDTTLSHGEGRLADLVAGGRLLAAAREVQGRASNFGRARRRVVWHQALVPLAPRPAARLYHRVRSEHPPFWQDPVVDEGFAEAVGLDERRSPTAVPDAGAVPRTRRHHYRNLTDPLLAETLEEMDRQAAVRGVQPRYPFLDRRLMEFCLSLPPALKVRRGRTRIVLRRGLSDRLPRSVRERGGKADLSHNFDRALAAHGPGVLDRALNETGVEEFVDRAALDRARAAFFEDPDGRERHAAAMRVWKATTAATWLAGSETISTPPANDANEITDI